MKQIIVKHRVVDGKPVVEVPLDLRKGDEGGYCIMDEDAFDLLLQLSIPPILTYKQGCVWCRSKAPQRYSKMDNIAVARIIADCGKNQCVRYLDKNPKNLTRGNIVVLGGMSLYRARDRISKVFPPKQYELIHIHDEEERIAS